MALQDGVDDFLEHGTKRAYRSGGCRCDECRSAFSRTRWENADPAGFVELERVAPPGEWMRDARCRTVPTSVFFPVTSDPTLAAQAKQICAACSVADDCRRYAIGAGPSLEGIWGGLTARERARAKRDVTINAPPETKPTSGNAA